MSVKGRCLRVALSNYVLYCQCVAVLADEISKYEKELEGLGVSGVKYDTISVLESPYGMDRKVIDLVTRQEEAEKDIKSLKRQIQLVDDFIESIDLYEDRKLINDRYILQVDDVTYERYCNDVGYSVSGMSKHIVILIEEYISKK